MRIVHLYLSAGHNFYGHHGKAPSEHEMNSVTSIECVAGKGIQGDRFFDYKPNYKGQITFFSHEIYKKLQAHFSSNSFLPSAVRRNVITEGVDLNQWIGKKFEIQGIEFEGTEECKPCYWMDQAIAPGAEEFLKGNGGLRARILMDGTLHL